MKSHFCLLLLAMTAWPSARIPAQTLSSPVASSPPARTHTAYTVTRKWTRVQTLANGATITQEHTIRYAVDSTGKSVSEQREIVAQSDGSTREHISVNVNDRVNRVHTYWSSLGKQAIVTHEPAPATRQTPSSPATPTPSHLAGSSEHRNEVQTEDLGTRLILGLSAHGTRFTRVIPVGQVGNDQPITLTQESWRARELPTDLLDINEDPRSGKDTWEATEYTLGEPDPALFEIPEGYTVTEKYTEERNGPAGTPWN